MKAITGEVVGRVFFGENLSDYKIQNRSMTSFLGDLIAKIGSEPFETLYLLFGKNIVKLGLIERHRKIME